MSSSTTGHLLILAQEFWPWPLLQKPPEITTRSITLLSSEPRIAAETREYLHSQPLLVALGCSWFLLAALGTLIAEGIHSYGPWSCGPTHNGLTDYS